MTVERPPASTTGESRARELDDDLRTLDQETDEKRANQKLAELRGTPAAPHASGEQPTVAEVSRRYLLSPARGGKPRKPRRSRTSSRRRARISCRSSARGRSTGSTPAMSRT
jgi:hypothetical protein